MSDYLNNLVARSFTPLEEIQPRLATRFESPFVGGGLLAVQPMNAEPGEVVQALDEPESSTSGLIQPLGNAAAQLPPPQQQGPVSELQVSLDMPPSPLNDFTSRPQLSSEQPIEQARVPQAPSFAEQRSEQTPSQAALDPVQPVLSQGAEPYVQARSVQLAPQETRQHPARGAPPLFMTPLQQPTPDIPPGTGTNGPDQPGPELLLQPVVVERTVFSPEVRLTAVREDTPAPRKASEQDRPPGSEPLVQQIMVERALPAAEPRASETSQGASSASPKAGDQHPRPMLTPAIERPRIDEVERIVAPTKSPLAIAASEAVLTEDRPPSKTPPLAVRPHVVSRIEASAPDTPIGPPASVPTSGIQVTIGRIEVRATPPPAPLPKTRRPPPPVMSLDDYLRQRSGRSAQ